MSSGADDHENPDQDFDVETAATATGQNNADPSEADDLTLITSFAGIAGEAAEALDGADYGFLADTVRTLDAQGNAYSRQIDRLTARLAQATATPAAVWCYRGDELTYSDLYAARALAQAAAIDAYTDITDEPLDGEVGWRPAEYDDRPADDLDTELELLEGTRPTGWLVIRCPIIGGPGRAGQAFAASFSGAGPEWILPDVQQITCVDPTHPTLHHAPVAPGPGRGPGRYLINRATVFRLRRIDQAELDAIDDEQARHDEEHDAMISAGRHDERDED